MTLQKRLHLPVRTSTAVLILLFVGLLVLYFRVRPIGTTNVSNGQDSTQSGQQAPNPNPSTPTPTATSPSPTATPSTPSPRPRRSSPAPTPTPSPSTPGSTPLPTPTPTPTASTPATPG